MQLVETIQLQKSKELSALCHRSKSLYNLGLYYIQNYSKFIINSEYLITLDENVQKDFKQLFLYKRNRYLKKKNEYKEKKSLNCFENKKKQNEEYKLIRKLRCPKFLNGYDLKWILKWHPIWNQFRGFVPVAQNTLLKLASNYKTSFNAIKDWKRHPEKYEEKPRFPGFKRKNSEWLVIFNKQQFSIKKELDNDHIKNMLCFPVNTKLNSKEILTPKEEMGQICIIPKFSSYFLKVNYNDVKEHDFKFDKERMIAIDIGVNNLACVVNNIGLQPFSINGKPLKYINHVYNKEKGKQQSIFSKSLLEKNKKLYKGKIYKKDGTLTKRFIEFNQKQASKETWNTKYMKKLSLERYNKINDYMHKASRYIINYCIEHNIGSIIIGKNPLWKQKSKMSKKNNQNFVQIPFNNLIHKIGYKTKLIGVRVRTITEEYTSKCSFLDKESIRFHTNYKGKRGVWKDNKFKELERGGRMFQTSEGILINADANGAYNIMKKANPKAINADGIRGVQLHPILVNLNTKSKLVSIKTS